MLFTSLYISWWRFDPEWGIEMGHDDTGLPRLEIRLGFLIIGIVVVARR
jgi:hypothetical protein